MADEKITPDGTESELNQLGLAPGHLVGTGRYTLKKFLSQGGMGVVWLAQDERLSDVVALKFLPTHDAGALDDLRRETQKSRRLTHPNIIRIHDFFEAPGEIAFLCMEYVDGPTLHDLRFQQPGEVFSWEYLQPIVKQLCDALEYAHDEKVIHRDLKPGNMMLDSRGRLKLADFGIAIVDTDPAGRDSARHGASGTLTHMSPQQMDGLPPEATDDIYALGTTLFELLSGQTPFYSGDVALQVRNFPPTPIQERLRELKIKNPVPHDVAAMIMACLAKKPEHRPQSARAIADWIGLGNLPASSAASIAATVFSEAPVDKKKTVRKTAVLPPPKELPRSETLRKKTTGEVTLPKNRVREQDVENEPIPKKYLWIAAGIVGLILLIWVVKAIFGNSDKTPTKPVSVLLVEPRRV